MTKCVDCGHEESFHTQYNCKYVVETIDDIVKECGCEGYLELMPE